jgi:transcriptional regulator with XRE-family HTH domain
MSRENVSGFGWRLREAREKRGWTQKVLADKLGWSRPYISMLEAQPELPDRVNLKQIRECARLLEVDWLWLLENSNRNTAIVTVTFTGSATKARIAEKIARMSDGEAVAIEPLLDRFLARNSSPSGSIIATAIARWQLSRPSNWMCAPMRIGAR